MQTRMHLFQLAAGLAVCGTLASCVSQQQYEESVALAKAYQTELHDKEQALARAETEADRLRADLRRNQAEVLEAGFSESVEARMSELQKRLEELGRPPGDIERFDVEGGYVLMIQDQVLFESGSAEVEEGGRTKLMQLAREIQAAPHGRVLVRGHTDSDPVKRPETVKRFPNGNLQLSAERAVSVASILIGGGVAPADVVVAGHGQWQPVAANESEASKRLNRRVEIFVADAE